MVKCHLKDLRCDAPHLAPSVRRGCHFFFPVYYKLINFKLVNSYNVKLYSVAADYKIYTSSIHGSVTPLTRHPRAMRGEGVTVHFTCTL